MFCHYCGKEIKDSAAFCPYCGKSTAVNVNQKTESAKKKKNPVPFIIILLVVIFASILAVVIWKIYFNDSTSKTLTYERDTSLVTTAQSNLMMIDVSELGLTATDSVSAVDALESISAILEINSAEEELLLKNENTVSGTAYYRFQQVYQGIPVHGKMIVLAADEDGEVSVISGNLVSMDGASTAAQITEYEAIETAIAYLEVEDADADVSLCYYVVEGSSVPSLAYAVEIGFENVFVDALYGIVLDEESMIDMDTSIEVTLMGQNEIERTVSASISSENVISLINQEKHIVVRTAHEDDNDIYVGYGEVISYQLGEKLNQPSAVDALYNIALSYEYYNDVLSHTSTDGNGNATIQIISDVGYYNGGNLFNNAGSGSDVEEKETAIFIGKAYNQQFTDAYYFDIMTHEYTHAVIAFTAGLSGADKSETAAINEGISDIMGEMAEVWSSGSCDWYHGTSRDLENPSGECIASYDEYTSGLDEHYGSTLISHSAYLMWTGDESKKNIEAINDVKLMSDLWYQTILLMNSDATFSDCRICCETAAEQMMDGGWLTEEQYNCVLWAFDQVGIFYVLPTSNLTTVSGSNIEINVYDYAENLTDQYVMTVTNAKGQVIEILDGETEGSSVTLNLGAGVYRVTVSSQAAAYQSVSSVITVKGKYDSSIGDFLNSTIDIYTTFGTSLQGQVTDEDGQPLEGVTITFSAAEISLEALEKAEEDEIPVVLALWQSTASELPEVTTDENGEYFICIPVGVYQLSYELDGYDSATTQETVNSGENMTDVVVLYQNSENGAAISIEDLYGVWQIDTQYTQDKNGVSMRDLFGSSASYGNKMEINSDSTYRFYYSFYGASGNYEYDASTNEIHLTTYEPVDDSLSYSDDDYIFTVIQDGDATYIRSYVDEEYYLYWIKDDESDSELSEKNDVIASGTCGDNLTWVLTNNGTLTISGTGAMDDFIERVDSGGYNYLYHPWENYKDDVISVIIEDNVTSIGMAAFRSCTNLTSVDILGSVANIGDEAFSDCTSLTSVTIPSSVTGIGDFAFYNCTKLASVTIPSSVTSVGDSAFSDCTSLTSVTIPGSVTSIGDFAFYNCTKLASVTIPDSVTSIGDSAFSDCTNLTSVTIFGGVTSIGDHAFFDCTSLTSLTIPDSVTNIGSCAFSNCTSLVSVKISNNVTNVGDSIFQDCISLSNVEIPDSVTSIGEFAFIRCSNLAELEIPRSVISIDSYAFYGCDGLNDVYFTGSKEEWNAIRINSYNEDLTNATIHYSVSSQ